jgi:hypothetical protein
VPRVRFFSRRRLPRRTFRRRTRHHVSTWRACVRASLPVVVFAVVVFGTAAVAGWLAMLGTLTLTGAPALLTYGPEAEDGQTDPGAVPIHLTTEPAGAEIRLDGRRRGVTPAQLALLPGAHTLLLHAPSSVDLSQPLDVSTPGASVSVNLWRLRPQVVPVRPVYPGAQLLDAQLVGDGRLVLRVDSSGRNSGGPALWQLSSGGNGIAPMADLPALNTAVATVALAPDTEHVAYATAATQPSSSLWAASSSIGPSTTGAETQTASVVVTDAAAASQRRIDISAIQKTAPEHVSDLIWRQDSQRLVIITRSDSTPARSRLIFVDVSADASDDDALSTSELSVLPAEVVPGSASVDPSGKWLAFAAHATTASNMSDAVTLCAIELRPGGVLRNVADLGSAARQPAVAPLAWSPEATGSSSARLAFTAPVAPTTSNASPGLFDIFAALRPASTPSGLFVVDLGDRSLAASQPRRIGTVTGLATPVWRNDSTIYGFSSKDDGSLSLRSVDVASGSVHDTGATIPAGTIHGTALGARWDVDHGRAVLLRRPAQGSGTTPAAGLQAWLVSFLPQTDEAQP